ncbi:hypothetical protein FOZ60_015375 [Perkinsus olseni]|uniref:RRM domain-containing protein n=1 Tax=Perkinsus olseni TaxID=32597 RepID=A0A7J6P5R7_PEROL|nr:hypothetical protein FOZ60_015375 [Perkinsus olseni]
MLGDPRGVFGSSRDAIENDNEEKDLNPADLAVVVVSGLVRPVRPAAVTRLLTNNSSVRIVREWTEPAKKSFAVVEYYDEGTARRMGKAIQDTKWNQEHRLVVDFLRRSQAPPADRKRGGSSPEGADESRKRHSGTTSSRTREMDKREIEEMVEEKQRVLSELRNHKFLPATSAASNTTLLWMPCTHKQTEKLQAQVSKNGGKFPTIPAPADYPAVRRSSGCTPCPESEKRKTIGPATQSAQGCVCAEGYFVSYPTPEGLLPVYGPSNKAGQSGVVKVLPGLPTTPVHWYHPGTGLLQQTLSGFGSASAEENAQAVIHRGGPATGSIVALRPRHVTLHDRFYHSGGGCAQCSGSDSIILPLVILSIIVVYHLTYNLMNREVQQAVTADVSIAMSIGSLVTYLQLIALFSEIGFDWSSEISTLLDIAKISLFNFDILRLECFMDGPQQSLWRYLTGFAPALCNHNVICVMLLAMVSTAVAPFQCYSHNDLGDRSLVRLWSRSVWYHPSSSSSFLIFCYQLNRWAGDELSGERGAAFSVRYRFLFYRLRQDRYQFGLWMMLRNVALALVPVIRPDDPYIKLLLFALFASFFIPEVVTVGPDGYKIALIVFFFLGLCYLLVQLGHELNGLWNKVMLVCSKDKSGYDFTEEMNQYELRRLSLLLDVISRHILLQPPPDPTPPRQRSLRAPSSATRQTALSTGQYRSDKAKHSTLNLDLVRLAKDRAVPLECLSSGVASLGRATILWGTEAYVTDAKVPLGRAWQQRCRQRQSDILELEADPRCVVALGMLDLSSAFAELESRFRVNPRERLNARRRLERQLKAKTKSKPEAESTSGPTSSTAEGHPNA